MYKYLGTVFLLILVFFYSPEYTLCDIAPEYDGTFYIYTYQNYISSNSNTTHNGNGYIISTKNECAKQLYSQLNKSQITGFSFETSGNNADINKLLKKLHSTVIFNEKIEKITFIYAYSPCFSEFVTYNNEKINIQIAKTNNTIQIGVPLILGSI